MLTERKRIGINTNNRCSEPVTNPPVNPSPILRKRVLHLVPIQQFRFTRVDPFTAFVKDLPMLPGYLHRIHTSAQILPDSLQQPQFLTQGELGEIDYCHYTPVPPR